MSPHDPAPITGARPLFPEEDIPGVLEQIGEVLRGGRLILGPRTRTLEEEWARWNGTKHAVALSSCSAALEIAMRWLRVEGRQVVAPTNTFVATIHAAINAGADVRFVDMDPRDFNLDVDAAIAALDERTAAVIVVHIAGFVAHGFERLKEACARRRIPLVEDCAHAHGSRLGGTLAGALGDIGCFSLYPTKILTSGVGGVLTTNDDELASFARSLRHHGQGASLEEIDNFGNDWLMDEVRAVLALAQLRRVDDFVEHRRAIAAQYDRLLEGTVLRRPELAPGSRPAYYKYPVLLPEGEDPAALRNLLMTRDRIEIGSLYNPPAHLMPVFRRILGTGPGSLPRAEALLARQVCLPMHAALSPADAARSVEAVLGALTGPRR